jgi:hypothetical protein
MTIPIWLLFIALVAVVAAVAIAYRSGYLMGEESAYSKEGYIFAARLRESVARGYVVPLPDDVDTVRERRAS